MYLAIILSEEQQSVNRKIPDCRQGNLCESSLAASLDCQSEVQGLKQYRTASDLVFWNTSATVVEEARVAK